jgi:hypothetical protein
MCYWVVRQLGMSKTEIGKYSVPTSRVLDMPCGEWVKSLLLQFSGSNQVMVLITSLVPFDTIRNPGFLRGDDLDTGLKE